MQEGVLSRRARLWRGAGLSAVSLLASAALLELLARTLLAREILSFAPVFRADAVAGYALEPDWSGYAFGADVDTNSLGQRGPEWSAAKAPGVLRIALIGDSIAFGFGVAFPQTLGELLAQRITARSGAPCEVLSFGVPGYNTLQESRVLERRVLGFAPDLVLVLLCGNDHEPELRVDEDGFLRWPPEGEAAAGSRVESPHVTSVERWGFWRHSALLVYARFRWSGREAARRPRDPDNLEFPGVEPEPGPIPQSLERQVLQPLCEMAALCEQRGLPLVVASVAPSQDYRRLVQRFRAETSAPVLDLLALLPEVASWADLQARFDLGWDPHPNPTAHALWAEGLSRFLAERDLLPGW